MPTIADGIVCFIRGVLPKTWLFFRSKRVADADFYGTMLMDSFNTRFLQIPALPFYHPRVPMPLGESKGMRR
jgi:hypothetical protein